MDREKIKPSFDTNRQILGEILPLDTPFSIIMDTSSVCNFKCNYCFRVDKDKRKWGYAKEGKIMDWDIFQRTIAQIQEFPDDVKQISLSHSGEPLCNKRLSEMVRYIKKQGLKGRVSIHTNASLLNEQMAFELAESKIDRIVVSMQGITGEKYEQVCGVKIDFESFYHNLQKLYQYKKDTQICIKIADTALDAGEEERFYEMFTPIADRVFVERIVPIWKDVDIKAKESENENKFGVEFEKQECCPLIFHTMMVTPAGDIHPCTQILSDHVLGNVRSTTLLECFNSDRRRELLLEQLELRKSDLCKDCYIPQNTIYAKEDMIDSYRQEIRNRILQKGIVT